MKPRSLFFLAIGLLLPQTSLCASMITGPWAGELQPRSTGKFPPLENCEADFVFGWSNVAAGMAEFQFQRVGTHEYKAKFSGETTGWVRTLWQADITYETRGTMANLQPIWFRQIEKYRRYLIGIEAEFTAENVRRIRQRIPSPDKASWRSFHLPGLRDILAAMLFVRSQSLEPGEKIVTLCYPGDAPYLIHISVVGNENIRWQEKSTPAIRMDLNIQRIETRSAERGQLRPHRRFRSGSVWISNDNRRLPLRAEVSIFVGFVYAELIAWQDN